MNDARDEVDELVVAWRRERPDLDTSPMEVLSRVDRLARHVDGVRAAAFNRHGLEGWEFDVLAALRRSGPPYRASPGVLVRATGVTSGTMTNRVDRLVARGLVRHVGIHHAMAVPAVLCAGIVALAATMPREDRDLT